jgi:peptidoglycan hydrolase CwlO-like protein
MNAPSPDTPSVRPDRRTRVLRWVLLLVALLSVGLGVGLVLLWSRLQETETLVEELSLDKQELETEIRDLDDRMQALDKQLAEANRNLEAKTAEVERLLRDIAYLNSQVQGLIRLGRITEQERDRYQGMSEQLAYYNTKYRGEIAKLQRENDSLRVQVSSLAQGRDSALSIARDAQDRASMAETQLEGSRALAAVNLRAVAVKRTTERVGPALKARDIQDELRICGELAPNSAAPRGERLLHLVLLGPNTRTQTVRNTTNPGCSFTFGGQLLSCSAFLQTQYQGRATPICVRYRLAEGERLPVGTYVAQLYADGFRLGETTFTVE